MIWFALYFISFCGWWMSVAHTEDIGCACRRPVWPWTGQKKSRCGGGMAVLSPDHLYAIWFQCMAIDLLSDLILHGKSEIDAWREIHGSPVDSVRMADHFLQLIDRSVVNEVHTSKRFFRHAGVQKMTWTYLDNNWCFFQSNSWQRKHHRTKTISFEGPFACLRHG